MAVVNTLSCVLFMRSKSTAIHVPCYPQQVLSQWCYQRDAVQFVALMGSPSSSSACHINYILTWFISHSVERGSWYAWLIRASKMHFFLLIYFNNHPVHVSNRVTAHTIRRQFLYIQRMLFIVMIILKFCKITYIQRVPEGMCQTSGGCSLC